MALGITCHKAVSKDSYEMTLVHQSLGSGHLLAYGWLTPRSPIITLGRVWLALLAGNVRAPFMAPFMPWHIPSSVLLPISCYWSWTDLQRLILSSRASSMVISPLTFPLRVLSKYLWDTRPFYKQKHPKKSNLEKLVWSYSG